MAQTRLYHYVGSKQIRESLPKTSHRLHVTSPKAVMDWLTATRQPREPDNTIVVTFIIDRDGALWINDRRSEHVLCADGGAVLSAGEMIFSYAKTIEVIGVSNQSTGYCPEPESWPSVEKALETVGIPHPENFTMLCTFRRCDQCNTLNLVKDDWFVCAVCQSALSQTWNLA